ncbi:unnamed protein product [Cyprideis torosa]|uniref:Uncharacterized protein n=1 Tax=Cyprideis torosa TaxID=163714 RepID=A0A7R8W7I5_9CRUS|nr:unnamed protein product [Cyprideis torosa]CAG0882479.1 unnamed protein product [Cyprideis torosa]
MIVLLSFVVHILIYGVSFTYASLSAFLVKRWGCRRVVIIGGILSTTGFLISSVAPNLDTLYFTYSVMCGVGFGIAYIPSIVIIDEYFTKRRTIAVGIACSGIGLGSFIYPHITRFALYFFGWRGAFLICAGLTVNISVAGLFMKPGPLQRARSQDVEEEDESSESSCHRGCDWGLPSVFHSLPYDAFCLVHFFFFVGYSIFQGNMSAYSQLERGMTIQDASLLMSIVGIMNLIGRIAHGFICFLPQVETMKMFTFSTSMAAFSTCALSFVGSFTGFSIVGAVYGLSSACIGSLTPEIIISLVGHDQLPTGYGFIMVFEAMGTFLGGFAGGFLQELTDQYQVTFMTGGACFLSAAMLMFIPLMMNQQRKKPPLLEEISTVATLLKADED